MPEEPIDRRELSLMQKLSLPEAGAPPWSLLGAAASLLAMLLCLALIGPALVTTVTGREALYPADLMLSWSIGLALTALFVLVRQRSSAESWRALRLVKGELPLPLTLLAGIAFGLAVDVLAALGSGAFLPPPQIWGFQQLGGLGALSAALMLVLLQPLAETLVFQGLLLPRMRWQFGAWRGIFGTTAAYIALYALLYMPAYAQYDIYWHGRIFPAGIGLLFCLLKVYTQSTGAALLGRMGCGLIFLLTSLALAGA